MLTTTIKKVFPWDKAVVTKLQYDWKAVVWYSKYKVSYEPIKKTWAMIKYHQ